MIKAVKFNIHFNNKKNQSNLKFFTEYLGMTIITPNSSNQKKEMSNIPDSFAKQTFSYEIGNEEATLNFLKALFEAPVPTYQEISTKCNKSIYLAEQEKERQEAIANVKYTTLWYLNPLDCIFLYKDDKAVYHFLTTTKLEGNNVPKSTTVPLLHIGDINSKVDKKEIQKYENLYLFPFENDGQGDGGPFSIKQGIEKQEIQIPSQYIKNGELNIQKLRLDVVEEQITKGKLFFKNDEKYYWTEDDLFTCSQLLNISILVKEKNKIVSTFSGSKFDSKRVICIEYDRPKLHYRYLGKKEEKKEKIVQNGQNPLISCFNFGNFSNFCNFV